MTVLNRSICEDCGRILYERGGHLMIEAARMATGTAPADTFMAELERSGQLDKLADIAIRFEDFARTGTLSVPVQLKHIENGIHQVKAVTVRLLFYYTNHFSHETVRLTNGYIKRARECPPKYIRLARRVRHGHGKVGECAPGSFS
ncbi:MAG TPA: hypothetical protein VFM55_14240 [Micromonosporaceae bacterium]|nr:hypothetical protein [Micromonosporaceae bacterium]